MTPCVEWTGSCTTQGYGQKWFDGRLWMMHRRVMAEEYGEDAIKGKVVRHKCDNPSCYRLDHLEIGTQADNLRDMHERGRDRWSVHGLPTHCKQGHEYTDENTYVRTGGARQCIECRKAYKREWRAKRRAEGNQPS